MNKMREVAIFAFKIVTLPFYGLYLAVEELSGEGRWYREQRRQMECDRPPLPDADFLRMVAAEPHDRPFWLAMRLALAESTGVPAEAIHPTDRLADLWRMQLLGPDFLDLLFRLERALAIKLPAQRFDEAFRENDCWRTGTLGDLAASFVRVVRAMREGWIEGPPDQLRAEAPRGDSQWYRLDRRPDMRMRGARPGPDASGSK